MSSDSPRHAIARQWELLKLLPSASPGKSSSDLMRALAVAGYTVTKRTVERDLEALESLFPITHGQTLPFDWHWMREGSLGVMGLSTTDALSLHLLERFLKPILPQSAVRQLQPVFDLAKVKLTAQRQANVLGSWAQKVTVVQASLAVVPAAIDLCALQTVQDALLADEQVEVNYVRSNVEVSRPQTLHPLGLVQCGSITYLVALAFHHTAPRVYAMHRVRAARRLHLAARSLAGFSLQDFVDGGGLQFGEPRRIRLKAWVSPMLAHQLADTKLCENQRLEPCEDGFVLTATMSYSWRLRWWILSKSGDIEILAPTELRSEVGGILIRTAARYAPPDDQA